MRFLQGVSTAGDAAAFASTIVGTYGECKNKSAVKHGAACLPACLPGQPLAKRRKEQWRGAHSHSQQSSMLDPLTQNPHSLSNLLHTLAGYMAPEQFRGGAQPESDLYALGATLLFLLSGGWSSKAACWDS